VSVGNQRIALWVAQGFGVGRIPVAPGTLGSVLGLGWFALLLLSGSVWVLLAGSLAGFFLSVWLCGAGERILGKKDPGSVVLDEVTAIPVCFLGWVFFELSRGGVLPGPGFFFSHAKGLAVLGVFVAFRFFDVAKPWPVRQSQVLPSGWGITVDDFLAAVYVNVVVLLAILGTLIFANRR
jgi:phosphatidylglycerophosphatase A